MVNPQTQHRRHSLAPAYRVVCVAAAVVVVSAVALGASTVLADHRPGHRGPAAEQAGGQWYFTGGTEAFSRGSGGNASAFSLDLGRMGEFSPLSFNSGAFDPGASDRRAFTLTLSDDDSVGRVEFTVGRHAADEDDLSAYTLVLRRSFDGDSTAITPHLMAGLGMAYTKDDRTATSETGTDAPASSWKPTIQVGLGASYEVTPSWELMARVRAFVTGTEELTIDRDLAIGSQDYQISQDFMVGTRLRF